MDQAWPSTSGYQPEQSVTIAASPTEVKPAAVKPEQESKAVRPSVTLTTSFSSDADEGRYRNHPLYNEAARTDGLYHCPWEDNPEANCPHKPTKLKCNYEYAHGRL